MKKAFFIILTILSITASAQIDSSLKVKPKYYPNWTLLIPGATHFYDNRILEGLVFSATEIGGITLGIIYDDKLKSNSTTPYYNFPLLIGMQAYNIDKCDWMRNRMELLKYYYPDFKYDPVKFNDLLKAPFKAENIFTSITGGAIIVALAELFIGGRHTNNYGDIDKMSFFNRYIDKNSALAIYGATSLATSYGAGIAEEYYFRNAVMPLLDYKYGKKKGLIYSSLAFGSMHFSNVLFSNNPDYGATLLQVAEASIIGYFLGRDVQNRGYKIGPAVSAHMWYDFTLMVGSFLIDPKNNYLGVDIKFKI
ncbi:MAG: CPBP family intramembrane metalloprotease [Bacteroidetes bacterium]|nr:CPBP family intramembrane metalloprotease [Bacteroidota bacterium]